MSEAKKPKKTIPQRIVGFFVDVYLWTRDTFTDDQARAALLTDLGLPADAATTKLDLPKDKLDSLQRYRDATDVDTAAFLQSIDDLKVIADVVKGFIRAAGVSGEASIEEYSHRVFQLLSLNYLRMHQPGLYWAAQPFGFIEESLTTHSTAKAYPERFVSFFKGIGDHFKQLGVGLETEEQARGFSDLVFLPAAVLGAIIQKKLVKRKLIDEVAYGWESQPSVTPPLADVVSDRIFSFLMVKEDEDESSESAVSCSVVLVPKPHGGPGMLIAFGGGVEIEVPLDDEWTFKFRIRSANAVDFFLRSVFDIDANAGADADASFSVETGTDEATAKPYVLGLGDQTRLEFGRLALSGEISSAGAGIKLTASNSALVINGKKDGDAFISDTMPDETRIAFEFGLGLSSSRGLYLEGGAGLRAIIPIGKTIGPLTIQHLQLGLVPHTDEGASDLVLVATAAVAFDLGPVRASLDQIGFQTKLDFAKKNPNLGLADLSIGFAPPKGVGLAVDGDVVSGGGFLLLDPDQGRYAGILHLDLGGGVALKAIGLLDTHLPGGQKGFSLLAIITVEGFKSIPLGFGFFLSGVGGLIGIHRTILHEPLLAGVRNHTLDHILFAEDPVRNAPALIATISTVFPPLKGRHLFCLMIQATFGKPALVHINLALGIEYNAASRSISKFFVMGQIKSILPDKDKDLIRLHMDVAGIIDFEQKTAAFEAALFDSRLARTFTISGQMALRARWGDSPNFALAIGGFHPDFAAPNGFPKLTRVTINLCEGENPRVRCEAYLALTSNTTQFGAKVEVFAKVSKFSVQGHVKFDVLVQHDPLQFNAAFEAMVQLKVGATNLFMIRLRGQLIGPSPMHISGKATFGILWWDYTVSFDKTLARGERPPLPAPVDAGALLMSALRDRGNWSHELTGTDRALVTLREPTPGTEILIHPLSRLSVRQRVLPLNRQIARFGSARPSGAREFRISEARVNGDLKKLDPVSEYFAPAQFFDIPDDQKLSGPSFELMAAGIRIGAAGVAFGSPVAADLGYEEIIVDSAAKPEPPAPAAPVRLDAKALFLQVQWGAASLSGAQKVGRAKYRGPGIAVTVVEPRFAVAQTANTSQPAVAANLSFSEAKAALQQIRRVDPVAFRNLNVVPQEVKK